MDSGALSHASAQPSPPARHFFINPDGQHARRGGSRSQQELTMNPNATFTTSDESLRAPLLVRDRSGEYFSAQPEDILHAARALLERKLQGEDLLNRPEDVQQYLRIRTAHLEHEVFGLVHLDAQHRLIRTEEIFRGTLSQATIYPREIVKECLRINSAAVILYHNHPSGSPEPSRADEALTQQLKAALNLVDVRVLDHIVVTNRQTMSFAQRGLL
jgi:DNA repair protein RadC